jgi:hypothetical protein
MVSSLSIFMMLTLTCGVLRVLVFHLSWCEVTVVRFDAVVWARFGMVEPFVVHQVMWFVMLKSAKDRVIGVDTPWQQVPPRVRYGTACLLIRDDVGKCALLGWVGIWRSYSPRLTRCKRGRGTMIISGNLSNAMVLRTTLGKLGIRPIVNLCNDM